MLSEGWRALVRKYIVYDVPDEMAACFDCNAVQCPNEKYETCPNRLAHATSLKAARARTSATGGSLSATIAPLNNKASAPQVRAG